MDTKCVKYHSMGGAACGLRRGPAAISAAMLTLACAETTVPNPTLLALVPSSGVTTSAIPVAVYGRGFYLSATQQLRGPEPLIVHQSFAVHLHGEAAGNSAKVVLLEQLEYLSEAELTVTVPAGITPGPYTAVLRTASSTTSLASAYTALTALVDGSAAAEAGERDVAVTDTAAVDRTTLDAGAGADQLIARPDASAPDSPLPDSSPPDRVDVDTPIADSNLIDTAAPDSFVFDAAYGFNTPPVAAFTVTPGTAEPPADLLFDASPSWDNEDPLVALSFEWDCDNDGVVELSGLTTSCHFDSAGQHLITLFVTDTAGAQDAFTGVVALAAPGTLIVVDHEGVAEDDTDGVLTLPEAIRQANNHEGPDVITFAGPMTISLGEGLPNLSDPGTTIVGQPGVLIDGSDALVDDCVTISADHTTVLWMEIAYCNEDGLDINNVSNVQVAHCVFRDNGGDGIDMDHGENVRVGPHNRMERNTQNGMEVTATVVTIYQSRIVDNGDFGVFLAAGSDYAQLRGNVIAGNRGGVEAKGNLVDVVLWHNTLYANGGDGAHYIAPFTGQGHSVHNNIFSDNSGYGMDSPPPSAAIDFNLFHGNIDGVGMGFSPGADTIALPPLFLNAPLLDLRLRPDSPCVDSATYLGRDRNGALADDFLGQGPDRGAHESY